MSLERTSSPDETSATTVGKPEKSITIVVPTLGRKSLQKAISSCGDLPVITEKDTHRTGEGPTRNRAIQRVRTEWVGFLDDDDELTPDYADRFKEAKEGADVIIFRMRYPDGRILPRVPQIAYGNVGIAFAVKTDLIKKHPFVKGERSFLKNEDYVALKTLEDAGAKIVFSPHICYLVKVDPENQRNAVLNR